MIRSARLACCAMMCSTLSGCVIPVVFNDHPAARGRVVDAHTRMPLAGAEVTLGDAYISKTVYTDPRGFFSIPTQHHVGLRSPLAYVAVPSNLFVSLSGYTTVHRKLPGVEPIGRVSHPSADVGTIALKPL